MNNDYIESKSAKKPNILFRAAMIFIIAALVVINVVLTYSTNTLLGDIKQLEDELKKQRLKVEEYEKRLGNGEEMTEEEKAAEAKRLGYRNGDDQKYEAGMPNS